MLSVLRPFSETATLLGKFSIVCWSLNRGFHAGTTPRPDGPFRNKLSEPAGTFSTGRVPATKFRHVMPELLRSTVADQQCQSAKISGLARPCEGHRAWHKSRGC